MQTSKFYGNNHAIKLRDRIKRTKNLTKKIACAKNFFQELPFAARANRTGRLIFESQRAK